MGISLGEGKKITNTEFAPNMRDHEINLSKECENGPIRLRLVGDVHPAFRYWVNTVEGKTRTVITPYFNPETEEWEQGDPLQGYNDARREFFYSINCIDRATNTMRILIFKKTIYQFIYSIATDPDYGNPADPDSGYDIVISKEKTGPLPMNVKYAVLPGRNTTALTAEEKAMELFDLDTVYAPMSKDAYLDWIQKNTFALTTNTEIPEQEGEDDIPF